MTTINIAVVGAGIIGLASAVNIQQKIPQARVTIIADKFAKDTTSDGAAGLFRPTYQHIKGVQPDLLKQWVRDSSDHFRELAAKPEGGKYGIFPTTGFQLLNGKTNPPYKDFVYSVHELTPEELRKLGTTYSNGLAVTTFMVEPSKYMPLLMRQFRENGGRTENRTLQSLEELVGHYDIVVNCSGLNSKWLVNDKKMYTLRGQLIMVKAPWIKQFYFTEDDAYIIPRSDDVVLGGVREREDYGTDIRESVTRGILERCAKLVPSVKEAQIISEWAGLRPHRDPVRLETEIMRFKSGNLPVVHNYGHGANGIALSWGTGVHTCKLVQECIDRLRLTSRL